MNGEGSFAVRGALSALAFAGLLGAAGCSGPLSRLLGEPGAPAASRAAPEGPMPGRPLYSLTVGGAAPAPPSAAAPPFSVPPFSPADEIVGRWLLLFELSYPAVPSGPAEP